MSDTTYQLKQNAKFTTMKTSLLIICLFLLSITPSNSQGFDMFGGVDYFKGDGISYRIHEIGNGSSMKFYSGNVCAQLGIGYEYKGLRAEIWTDTYMGINNALSYHPIMAQYFAKASYTFKKNITFGIEHMCAHPVETDIMYQDNKMYGGYTKVSLRFKFKLVTQ